MKISAQDVFVHQSLRELATIAVPLISSGPGEVDLPGDVPLSPTQSWFFEKVGEATSPWNQWVSFRLPQPVSLETVRRSFETLAARHDVFGLRFSQDAAGWRQTLTERRSIGLEVLERPEIAVQEFDRLQGSLDLEQGPLMKAIALIDRKKNVEKIFLTAHHLVVDQVSWFVFLDEFERTCQAYADGSEPSLGPSGTRFSRWARSLAEKTATSDAEAARNEWLNLDWSRVRALPQDVLSDANREKDARIFEQRWSADETARLKRAQIAFRTRIDDFLVLALSAAFQETLAYPIAFEVEQAGRRDALDVSRTLGWFTELYPVVVEPFEGNLDRYLKTGKERLRRLSHLGGWFGLLKNADPKSFAAIPRPAVGFNFLGEMDPALSELIEFGTASNERVVSRNPDAARTHEVMVDAWISGGALKIQWSYSSGIHQHATVERWAKSFESVLRSFVESCLLEGIGGRTASDFPHSGIGQTDLDTFIAGLSETRAADFEDLFPLTPLQEGLLFHSLSEPESDHYLVQLTCKIDGALDERLFQESWRTVLNRHPNLRSGFHHRSLRQPLQAVEKLGVLPWSCSDLTGQDKDEKELFYRDFLVEDRNRRFDLAVPPLMRFHLFRFEEGQTRFLWTHHHILIDGWSMAIVVREVFSVYEALRNGLPVRREPVHSYRSFVAQLSQSENGPALEAWKSELAGVSHPTPLPNFPPDAEIPPSSPAEWELGSEETERLNRALQQRRLTLATALQGVWAVVLSAFSGEDDVVFGNTVSGRNVDLKDVEELVGLCINTIPQRVRIDLETSLERWLHSIQNGLLKTRPYEHCGLVEIQGVTGVKRTRPLFESSVVLENYPMEDSRAEKNRPLGVYAFDTIESIGFPMTLMAIPGERFRLRLFFDRKRFSDEGTRSILATVGRLLASIPDRLDQTLRTLYRDERWNLPTETRQDSAPSTKDRTSETSKPTDVELESALTPIWSEILNAERIGPEDDFYELGGHSLNVMQMRSRIQERLNLDVPIVDLMQHSTIRSLATFLTKADSTEDTIQEAFTRAEERRKRTSVRRTARSSESSEGEER